MKLRHIFINLETEKQETLFPDDFPRMFTPPTPQLITELLLFGFVPKKNSSPYSLLIAMEVISRGLNR